MSLNWRVGEIRIAYRVLETEISRERTCRKNRILEKHSKNDTNGFGWLRIRNHGGLNTVIRRGAQIFHKTRSHKKILGAWVVICTKFHAEDRQVLGAAIQKQVTRRGLALGTWAPLRYRNFGRHTSEEFGYQHIKELAVGNYTTV